MICIVSFISPHPIYARPIFLSALFQVGLSQPYKTLKCTQNIFVVLANFQKNYKLKLNCP